MKVLVTGYRGFLGRRVVRALAGAGHDVLGYDLADGDDVTDKDAVAAAIEGCDAVVHLAARSTRSPARHGDIEEIVRVNALGSQHVLEACLVWGVPRLVLASSLEVLGIGPGEGTPNRFPIDDAHPADPMSADGIAKRAVERVAKLMSSEEGLTTICLRLAPVLDPAAIGAGTAMDAACGSWIHVDDAVAAFVAAVQCPSPTGGHAAVLVVADDISTDGEPATEVAARLYPDVPWWDELEHAVDPRRSLVSNVGAKALLGWHPLHRWREP